MQIRLHRSAELSTDCVVSDISWRRTKMNDGCCTWTNCSIRLHMSHHIMTTSLLFSSSQLKVYIIYLRLKFCDLIISNFQTEFLNSHTQTSSSSSSAAAAAAELGHISHFILLRESRFYSSGVLAKVWDAEMQEFYASHNLSTLTHWRHRRHRFVGGTSKT